MTASCELCDSDGGEIVYRSPHYRVVLVDDAAYPGFCRVIWNAHVKEMSDLPAADRTALSNVVWAVEAAVREVMQPEKINLATLGNMTPHLHWHVIPRYTNDAHFPSPVWAEARREAAAGTLAARRARLPELTAAIVRHIALLD